MGFLTLVTAHISFFQGMKPVGSRIQDFLGYNLGIIFALLYLHV